MPQPSGWAFYKFLKLLYHKTLALLNTGLKPAFSLSERLFYVPCVMTFSLGISILSLVIWLGLIGFRGQFWRSDQVLETYLVGEFPIGDDVPSVCIIIPARNEADLLPITLRSLLTQGYPGLHKVILVDDHSTDGTAQVARETAESLGQGERLHLMTATPLVSGWTGKLWALNQGVQTAQAFSPDYVLLADADIEHDPDNLQRLMTRAVQQDLDLASVMVRLRCDSFWEKLLIPAFVFFFQKLYPFRLVNRPESSVAAAAGGCILIRRSTLETIGGLQAIRHHLIDDCALAQAVKSQGGKLWLGLSDRTRSLRPYPSLDSIWDMVARTAFTQLNYSPLLLGGTLLGMALVYLVPPIGVLGGMLLGNGAIVLVNLATLALMTLAYFPTIHFYRCSPLFAGCLPIIALLYNLMTFDSALRHWQGRGGRWKGRVYSSDSQ